MRYQVVATLLLALAVSGCRDGGQSAQAKPGASSALGDSAKGQAAAIAKGHVAQHMVVDGEKREWVLHVPKSYDGKKKVPLVFMFHGSSGTGEKFYRISGWVKKADQEGFIAVFPTGLEHCIVKDGKRRTITKWNGGKLKSYVCEGQRVRNDVSFIDELLKRLKREFAIDSARVFASGFSNGGGFVRRLAFELSEQLAAVGIVAGGFNLADPKPKRLIPMYDVIGAKDKGLVAAMGGKKLSADPKEILDSPLGKRRLPLLTTLELTDDYKFSKQGKKAVTFKFNKSKTGKKNVFYLTVVRGMTHIYPNGKNHPAVAADRFWAFFNGKR